ncbi:MAG: DUF2237 domain-containing protein [Halobacteriovoraceae bacterium]|nr:DUF2237 domain-containing protein [Halobacteriovoraceae bacterium]
MEKNVLGTKLESCSCSPMTGWFRDGLCRTDFNDRGVHTVCGVVNQQFLEFSFNAGNDLITPRPEFDFPGLKPGDQWCICAGRWYEAYRVGKACTVVLEATNEETLAILPIDALKEFEAK